MSGPYVCCYAPTRGTSFDVVVFVFAALGGYPLRTSTVYYYDAPPQKAQEE